MEAVTLMLEHRLPLSLVGQLEEFFNGPAKVKMSVHKGEDNQYSTEVTRVLKHQ